MSKDWEKLKNLQLFGMYSTDKERDEFFEGPGGCLVLVIFAVVVIGAIIWATVS